MPSQPAVSVTRMQQLDAIAIQQFGIPRLLLMEHAGLAVARAAQKLLSAAGPVMICCGTGYNGGDGLAAARHLHGWGIPLRLALAGRLEQLREEPLIYATILQRLGLSIVEVTEANPPQQVQAWFAESCVLVDALLGIGTQGAVRQPHASLIAQMNRAGKPIVAVDIPSGLNGDTGVVEGCAVHATVTVTFGLPKQGCLIGDGPAHVGQLVVDPISMPPDVFAAGK